MFKVMRWMQSISEPNDRYHLCPRIRMETRTRHHVTWTSQGLLKEYNHRIDYTTQPHQPGLQHRPETFTC
jgi:hypothetical protein